MNCASARKNCHPPNYKLIEKYSKEMHKVDARLYFLETGKEEPGQ